MKVKDSQEEISKLIAEKYQGEISGVVNVTEFHNMDDDKYRPQTVESDWSSDSEFGRD